jgi:hypothetical protein
MAKKSQPAKRKKRPPKKNLKEGSPSSKVPKSKSGPPEKARGKRKAVRKVEVIYPELEVMIFRGDNPLKVAEAKKILGWQEESENVKFGNDFLLKDLQDKKIRCGRNRKNRPFQASLAKEWMSEVLKLHWKLNGETIIVDRLGELQSGQHRLIGLILAAQESILHPGKWRQYWKGQEPTMDTIIVVGVSEEDETINTIDCGKPRSLADVIYRSPFFSDLNASERSSCARVCSFAVKLIWHVVE